MIHVGVILWFCDDIILHYYPKAATLLAGRGCILLFQDNERNNFPVLHRLWMRSSGPKCTSHAPCLKEGRSYLHLGQDPGNCDAHSLFSQLHRSEWEWGFRSSFFVLFTGLVTKAFMSVDLHTVSIQSSHKDHLSMVVWVFFANLIVFQMLDLVSCNGKNTGIFSYQYCP